MECVDWKTLVSLAGGVVVTLWWFGLLELQGGSDVDPGTQGR